MEFEKGKWYKVDGNFYMYYGKFLEQTSGSGFISSEKIMENKHSKTRYTFCNGYKWVECHLSEIQQYLPDSHPDKKKEESRSWCVKVTKENIKVVKGWFNMDRSYSIGAYYGIDKRLKKASKSDDYSVFDKIISTEEFYQKIGHKADKFIPLEDVKMNKEDLLEEAKRRYPVGTEYYSAYSSDTKRTIQERDSLELRGGDISTQSGCYVYYDGKWGKIVSQPKKKPKKRRIQKSDEKDCTNTNSYGLNEFREGCAQECDECEYYTNINKPSINKKSKNNDKSKRSIKICTESSKVSRGKRPRGNSICIGRPSRTVKGRYQGNVPNLQAD